MTITTLCIKNRGVRGFTLVEVMIASTLAVLVLAGVLSSFLFIGRSGFSTQSYSRLEAEARRGLEIFAEDARMACDIHWNGNQSITLVLPTATNATTLATYAYDSDGNSATRGCFYRLNGDVGSTAARLVLIHNVMSDFAFQRYKLDSSGNASIAVNDLETKQIQLMLRAQLSGSTVVAATNSAVSARYILRNKHVSN